MTEPEANFDALQQHVDELHHGIERANLPPTDLWNSVRTQIKSSGKEEERSMMNNYAIQLDTTIPPAQMPPPVARGFRHHLSVASTLALVLTVALAGWLVTMQVNQPGGSVGQFALLGQNDEAAVCDVEPMTLDEVMEIVENPYKYAEPAAYGSPNSSPAPWLDEFAVVQPMVSGQLSSVIGTVPTDTAMEEALPVLDQHIACVENGTVAQSLRFVDPFSIQEYVTYNFAFYRNEEQVRNFVEDWISEGSQSTVWEDEETGDVLTFSPNRNSDEARTQVEWLGLGFNQVLWIGSNVMDEDGNALARHDAVFQVVDGEQQSRWTMYTMVYSMYTDQWYVVTGDWPMKARI